MNVSEGRPKLSPKQVLTLERFVLRARRVGAHSLVAGEGLDDLVKVKWVFRGSDSEPTRMQWTPPDEERFESLAARLRPLVLGAESIHYSKVIEALRLVVGAEPESQKQLDVLYEEWARHDVNDLRERSFTMQQFVPSDGISRSTADGVLAAGWMYADLVHADPLHGKEESLHFPLHERFHAAVPLFASIAKVTLATLAFVESVRSYPLLELNPEVWCDPVSIDAEVYHREVSAYVAPVGTPVPDLSGELSDAWRLVTADVIHDWASKPVRVKFEDSSGVLLGEAEAKLIPHGSQVEDGFKLSVEDDILVLSVGGGTGRKVEATITRWVDSNVRLASSLMVQSLASRSTILRVLTPDLRPLFVFDAEGEHLTDVPTGDAGLLRVAQDLVAVERLLGHELEPLSIGPTFQQARWLRVLRLALEGLVVRTTSGPLKATSPSGEPPSAVFMDEHELLVGNVPILFPRSVLHHPEAYADLAGPSSAMDAEGYLMTVPAGEKFLLVIPERLHTGETGMAAVVEVDMDETLPSGPLKLTPQ